MRAIGLFALLLLVPLVARAQVVYAPGQVGSVLGRMVVDKAGDEIGRIVDVLVDVDGRPRVAVVDVGGFLGIGTRRVAVAWRTLRFSHTLGDARITEDLTLDEVAAAPEYRGTDVPVEAIGPAAAQ